jgi:hypothetical protein
MAEPEKPKESREIPILIFMKKYKKVQVLAKNNPQGSYAAGCPAKNPGIEEASTGCKKCERTR